MKIDSTSMRSVVRLYKHANSLSELYVLNEGEFEFISKLFSKYLKSLLDMLIFDSISSGKRLIHFYRDFLKSIFAYESLSSEAKMYLTSLSMAYLFEAYFRIYAYNSGLPKSEFMKPVFRDKKKIVEIPFIFDISGRRIVDMFHVSNKDVRKIRKVVLKIADVALKKAIEGFLKHNFNREMLFAEVIKKILEAKLKDYLKIPAIIFTLLVLVEKVYSAIIEDIMINPERAVSGETDSLNDALKESEFSWDLDRDIDLT